MARIIKIFPFKKISYLLYRMRSKKMTGHIFPLLGERKKILDIGSGTGCIAEILKKNHDMKLVDIKNLSLKKEFSPIIFDGKKLPFGDKEFDVSLIVTVLHHTKSPESILCEAKRVSNKILLVEDVFSSRAKLYWDYAMDSLINFEIINHPHNNRSDLEWKKTFKKLGLELEKSHYVRSHFGFKHAIYLLRQ